MRLVHLIKVSEFIVLAVVNESLAVDVTELIIMAADFNFERRDPLIPIVVTLHNETIDAA